MTSSFPIKVLHLLYSFEMGGAQKVVANLVKHHDREKFTPIIGTMRSGGQLEAPMRDTGAEIVCFDKKSTIDIAAATKLKKFIAERGIRIVNAHNFTASLWGRIACMGMRDVGFVVTEHGRLGTPPARLRLFNRLLAGRVDRIIAVNEDTAEYVKSMYPYNVGKVRLVVNGIDIPENPGWSKLKLQQEFNIPIDSQVVVNVAAHTPVKDQAFLIQAFSLLSKENTGVKLLLIGDGPLKSDLEALAGELDLTGSVIFAGMRVDGPDIARACDVFCLSSSAEGTSIAALEAMARRCPVVLTAVGGNTNIIRDGVEGLLVPHGDEKALAGALERILSNKEFAAKLTVAATEKIETDFSAEDAARRTESVYSELL